MTAHGTISSGVNKREMYLKVKKVKQNARGVGDLPKVILCDFTVIVYNLLTTKLRVYKIVWPLLMKITYFSEWDLA